jgi:hypothetical protein
MTYAKAQKSFVCIAKLETRDGMNYKYKHHILSRLNEVLTWRQIGNNTKTLYLPVFRRTTHNYANQFLAS